MRNITELLRHWLPYLKTAGRVAIILLIALVIYLVLARMLRLAQRRGGMSPQVRVIIRSMLRWVFALLTVFLALGEMGVLHNVWAAVVGILAMIAIGFVAVWSVMSNVLCTLLLMIVRPFKIGDTVELPTDSLGGKVVNLNLMFTTLRDDEGRYVQVPNNTFFQKPVRRTLGDDDITLWEQLNTEDDLS